MENASLIRVFFRDVLACLAVLAILVAGSAHGENVESGEEGGAVVNVDFAGESLQEAATEIARQTGYQVVIEKEWAGIPVSGFYHGVSAENFFKRVLKGKNISIISSDEEKIIIVRLFGDKKLDNLLTISNNPVHEASLDPDEVDPTDGQKISEIRKLQALYDEELDRWKNDPDAVDPMDGQRISEIRDIQAEYDEEMERWKNDPDAVDPMDGQKISEIRALQAEHDAEMDRWKNDPEAVDPMDGQKISAIRELQVKRDAEMDQWENDPEAVEPESGIKVSVLRAVQAQQQAALGR